MKSKEIKRLAVAAVFAAVAVVGSLVSVPVLGAKCAPIQHIINVVCAIVLGPVYGVSVAFVASLIRNLLGLGTLLAFPGSMCGALMAGLLYYFFKKQPFAYIGEVVGTAIVGGLLAYPVALLFMLLYRLPEAFLVKMMNPFMLNPIADGGLGMTKEEVGLIYGTIGIAALTIGGILGGIAASKWGLKKSLWPMALSLTLPCLSFVFLAMFQPENNWIIGSCVALDQFGYGFGFTAYMLYLIYFSEGEFKTAHYSICTAFMALSMMLPGLVAGYVQEWLGYTNFFIFVMFCCLVTVAVTFKVKVDPEFGKKQN